MRKIEQPKKCVKYKIYMNFITTSAFQIVACIDISRVQYLSLYLSVWLVLECRHFIWMALNSFELFHSANWNNKRFHTTLFVNISVRLGYDAKCENLWQIEVKCVILFTILYFVWGWNVVRGMDMMLFWRRWRGFISYGIGLSSIWFDSIRFDSFQFISRHIEFLYTFQILHVYKSPWDVWIFHRRHRRRCCHRRCSRHRHRHRIERERGGIDLRHDLPCPIINVTHKITFWRMFLSTFGLPHHFMRASSVWNDAGFCIRHTIHIHIFDTRKLTHNASKTGEYTTERTARTYTLAG